MAEPVDAYPAAAGEVATGGRRPLLPRLARLCLRHRVTVLALWAALAVGGVLGGRVLGGHYRTDFRLPGTQSQRATDLLRGAFPAVAGDEELVVLHVRTGRIDQPAVRAAAARLTGEIAAIPHVESAVDPFRPPPGLRPPISARTTVILVHFAEPADNVPASSVRRLIRVVSRADTPAVQTAVTGVAVQERQTQPPLPAELIGLAATLTVLLLTFGSAVAAGLALLTALFAVASGIGIMSLLSQVLSIPSFTPELAAMVGLGVGIDYAMLLLTRYRAATTDGLPAGGATVLSLSTAGRTVLFAGGTVLIAMLGMCIVGLPFMAGMAVGVSLTVGLSVLASVTVLPALLGLLGRHVDRGALPGLHRRRLTHRSAGWERWADVVQRRPWTAVAGSLLVLGVLAAPAFALRLGASDPSTANPNTGSGRAYQLLSGAFGPGFTGSLTVVAQSRAPISPADLTSLEQGMRSTAGVASLTAARIAADGRVATFTVYPATRPSAAVTARLLRRLRGEYTTHPYGAARLSVLIGGATAIDNDLASKISRALPVFIGAVVAAALLLLLILFRSVLVPLKAAVMNLLSITAAFGVVVAVFQWGWGGRLIGVDRAGPIESFLPLMLFAIVFGLSMDYEVFLISRIREAWDRSRDNSASVVEGVSTTARVITAAAAIMVVVFGSFTIGSDRTVKLFGLGLAVAVFVDAALIRAVLVPATMELLGRANWWLPAWLDRVLPRVGSAESRLGRPDSSERMPSDSASVGV